MRSRNRSRRSKSTGAGGAVPVLAFGQSHGRIRSLGYRFGPVAYSPDVDGLDEEAFAALEGVECWIVDALRYTPHPSHAHLARTLEWIARVKPKRAILTNMHVDLDYDRLKRELPPGVEPAYDGMALTFYHASLHATACRWRPRPVIVQHGRAAQLKARRVSIWTSPDLPSAQLARCQRFGGTSTTSPASAVMRPTPSIR